MAVRPAPPVASGAARPPLLQSRRIVEELSERHAPRKTSDTEPAPAREAPYEDRPRNEQLFLDWLASPEKPDDIELVARGPSTALTAFLGALSTSTMPLPPSAARILALATEATVGEAAVQLIMAVNDPAGPRCRSYRAAVYFVHDLHKYAFNVADL